MGTYGEQVPPRDCKGMRTGYTTGSNAAGAAKAATLALLTGRWPEQVTVALPNGETTQMTPVEHRLTADSAYCCMVKDGGDDPDVTHGALICAQVRHSDTPGIALDGGAGVGRVTLPGLGLPVGAAAINPVPRQQIQDNVHAALAAALPDEPDYLAQHGLAVVISVPEGERIAQKTLNPRLGIMGGISILGTSGKVYPYSTAAWRASVVQAVQMAT
jgi:cobalt-precorrin-5B (C1)-methyltransferase